MGMKDALPYEVKDKVQKEMLEVLKKNNLPTTPNVRDAIGALLKEVSCQVQSGN
jgi:hypothetical protein